MGVGAWVVRGGGTARSSGRWPTEGGREREVGIWEGELGLRSTRALEQRSKVVCLRRVGIGAKRCFCASVTKVSIVLTEEVRGTATVGPNQFSEHIKTYQSVV